MARGSRHQKKVKNPIGEEAKRRNKLKRVIDQQPLNVDEELSGLLSEWVIAIDNFVQEGGSQRSSNKKCIMFRVPANMRELEESAYTPKLVSIGPFHANGERLQAMDEHKMQYLLRLLARCNKQDSAIKEGLVEPLKQEQNSQACCNNIESLAKAMKGLESMTRKCYPETESSEEVIPSHEFVMMMLLDGCFVIELLRLYNKFFNEEQVDDPIFAARWMLPLLQRDLFMLENQLPLFVLEKLLKLTSQDGEPSLTELTLKFFDALLPRETKMLQEKYKMGGDHDHLLGLFRSSFTSTLKKKQSQPTNSVTPVEQRRLVHPVTELQESGVKFKKRNYCDLLDIEFKQGVFEIPPLIVDDYTIPLFLNLVAYEQSCPERDPFFIDYVLFFDSLVNSPKDVEILHYEGIIEHVLGSDEEVANIFNKLCREVVYDVQGCYLTEHLKEVNRYTERKWNLWRAKLMHDYFNGPWAFLSLLGAIILLLLTIMQTILSVLPYLRPPYEP